MSDPYGHQPPSQGSAGGTDIVTALQGIIRQITAGNAALVATLAAINFPQTLNGYTVATLPSAPSIGMLAYVTDGTAALAWGATVTGGSSTRYMVFYNGSNWTVAGK